MPDHLHDGQDAGAPRWEALARYLAGESSEQEGAAIRASLDADPAGRAMVSALDDALRPAPLEPVVPEDVERALATVLARRGESPSAAASGIVGLDMYRRRWFSARRLAAAAVVVVAAGGMLWRASDRSVNDRIGAEVRFATKVGELDSIRLSDGTSVVLGPGSAIALAQDFAAGVRELTLKGQARFDVVHDPARPFVVHAGAATFRDVGTSFDLSSDAAEGVRIAVSEGAVAVRTTASAEVELRAGDRATIPRGSAPVVERGARSADDAAWQQGTLVFREASVAAIAAELRRWYGFTLVVQDPALGARRLTATFTRDSSGVGSVIAASLGGAGRRSGDTLYIMPLSSSAPIR